jgi:hypothetical protein
MDNCFATLQFQSNLTFCEAKVTVNMLRCYKLLSDILVFVPIVHGYMLYLFVSALSIWADFSQSSPSFTGSQSMRLQQRALLGPRQVAVLVATPSNGSFLLTLIEMVPDAQISSQMALCTWFIVWSNLYFCVLYSFLSCNLSFEFAYMIVMYMHCLQCTWCNTKFKSKQDFYIE